MIDVREKFESLSLRERGIILITVLAALWGLWSFTVGGYFDAEVATAAKRVQSLHSQIATLAGSQLGAASDAEDREREKLEREIRELQDQRARFESRLKEELAGFVQPQEIVALLRTLLDSHPGLELVELKNLRAEEVLMDGAPTGYFRHPLTMEFTGEYADVLRYLSHAEAADQSLSWRAIQYEVERYPRARVIIRLETISHSPDWIGV